MIQSLDPKTKMENTDVPIKQIGVCTTKPSKVVRACSCPLPGRGAGEGRNRGDLSKMGHLCSVSTSNSSREAGWGAVYSGALHLQGLPPQWSQTNFLTFYICFIRWFELLFQYPLFFCFKPTHAWHGTLVEGRKIGEEVISREFWIMGCIEYISTQTRSQAHIIHSENTPVPSVRHQALSRTCHTYKGS